MHSPCEVVSLKDIDNIIELLAQTVNTFEGDDFEPF
jgi:putative aminopeptidase FrvX